MLAVLLGVAPASWAEALTIRQGAVGRVEVTIHPGDSAPWGSFVGERVVFRRVGPERFAALLGVDMETAVGDHPLEVRVLRGGVSTVVTRPTVTVSDGGFGVQRLTLPDKMVDLDDAALERVAREKVEVGELWEQGARSTPVWSDEWRQPVAGEAAGSFGKRRIINGNPRNPHNGEDIAAPEGTPVLAPNAGTVRLAGERFFGGQTVFLEHGGGLFTFYMHLSAIDVADGQRVRAGERIGRVGASGRATGPHLHWGGRLNNARINPFTLLQPPAVLTVAAAPAADGPGTPAADQLATPPADQAGTPPADQAGTP
ncbi:MAG: M23 family metallopeptidase [Nitrospirae bacterium]|nr:M23 family metallopeptidase [Nitrospirota bacterium]